MKLSVVIPAYNEAQNLPKTVEAIYSELTKEDIEHEILVSNDNSEVRQSLDGVNDAVNRLNQTLDDGIEIELPIAGRNGLHKKLKDYDKILSNK